jgi:GrpB-like predicted nucleotidyltransferase (UPF0157 family)
MPYDGQWPVRAASELTALTAALGPLVLYAEHIGSTAVPQMTAKDIIDLQLSVSDMDQAADRFAEPLARLGYTRLPYQRDHVPAGDPSDPALWAKRYWHRRYHPGGDVNLHVRLAGAANERLALLFRDWLRTNPDAVAAYSQFKICLAGHVGDLGAYTDIKDPVVDLVIAAAGRWAAETGWQPHRAAQPGRDGQAPASQT